MDRKSHGMANGPFLKPCALTVRFQLVPLGHEQDHTPRPMNCNNSKAFLHLTPESATPNLAPCAGIRPTPSWGRRNERISGEVRPKCSSSHGSLQQPDILFSRSF